MGICVKDCPSIDLSTPTTGNADLLNPANYYCLSSLDAVLAPSYAISANRGDIDKMNYITANCLDTSTSVYKYSISNARTNGCLCNIKRATKSIFKRCIFTDSSVYDQYLNQAGADYIKTYIQDIMVARNVIFGFGFAVALFFSFVFLYLYSFETLACVVTWTCISGVAAVMIILVILANNTTKAWGREDPQVHTNNQIVALKAFSGIMMGIAGLYLCLMIFMRNAINVAIKCLAMASMAMEEMPFIVFSPILQVAALVVFLIPWVFYIFNLASLGEWQTTYKTETFSLNGVSTTMEVSTGKKWIPEEGNRTGVKLWFLFFCLLWTMNFIAGYGQTVISLAISKWYFTNPTERVALINNRTLLSAYLTVARYHLGTIAFGSLLIALIQLLRAYAIYLQKHCSEKFRNNIVVKFVFCCINCCLWCLECCMKFISKNAYIQTAIHGTSFMISAKNAFFTIARNILRIGAVFTVSHLAVLAGKLFVCMLATASSYYYFTGAYADQLHDFVGPTILVMIISWMTATMFFDVLQMAIDTILICYISDEEANGGTAIFAGAKMSDFVKVKHVRWMMI